MIAPFLEAPTAGVANTSWWRVSVLPLPIYGGWPAAVLWRQRAMLRNQTLICGLWNQPTKRTTAYSLMSAMGSLVFDQLCIF